LYCPHPLAKPTLLQYYCATIAQYTPSHRPPPFVCHTSYNVWRWHYRVKANLQLTLLLAYAPSHYRRLSGSVPDLRPATVRSLETELLAGLPPPFSSPFCWHMLPPFTIDGTSPCTTGGPPPFVLWRLSSWPACRPPLAHHFAGICSLPSP